MANAIIGSLMVTRLGALFAIPIGVMSGIYAAEYAGTRLAAAMRFAADTLNGVPSIVIGVFVYSIAVLPFRRFSALAGGLALGDHDDSADHADDRGTAAAGAVFAAGRGAGAGGDARARGVHRRRAGGAARDLHRHPARAGAHCGRDGAAALHGAEQRVLVDQPQAADLDADGADLHLRDLALRRVAPQAWAGALVLVSMVLLCSLLARVATATDGAHAPRRMSST